MKLKLISKKLETDSIITFTWQPEKPINWQAGQYLHYNFNHNNPDDRGTERWFTIAAPPYEKNIKITTRMAEGQRSTFKQALLKLKTGDVIEGDSPEGDFTITDLSKKYILIAGGIGITPFYSILKQLEYEKNSINADLLYLSRDENLVFKDDFEAMQQQNKSFCVHKFTGDRRLTDEELAGFADLENSKFYISGPKSMVGYYFDKLQSLGVPENRLKKDYFPGYQNY